MRYLFDADVLISAKNFHYNPGFCPEFWECILVGHNAGLLFSIDKVRDEMLNGNKAGRTLSVPARRPIKPIYVKKVVDPVDGA